MSEQAEQERIVREVQEELKTWCVPVVYTASGSFTVEASSREEAIEKAKAACRCREDIECPTVDIDFPDDIEDVEEVDDEEDP